MNNWTIAGRIGKDAEVRHTSGGDAVCGFDVAVESKVKGEKVTTWVRCSLWGERGEKLAPYLTKGSAVAVAGEAGVEVYTPRGGEAKAQLRMRVNQVTLQGGGQGETSRQAPKSRQSPADPVHEDTSDIPF